MQKFLKIKRLFALMLLALGLAQNANSQKVSYGTLASTSTQNFDGLATSGSFTSATTAPQHLGGSGTLSGANGWYIVK
jgi:hypothetical protein